MPKKKKFYAFKINFLQPIIMLVSVAGKESSDCCCTGWQLYIFSRGVLEAEQLRYQKLHEEQKKELEDTKSTFELKLESLNAREAAIEKRMSDFEQKELELAQSKADLKQKWNEYQQHAEALRNTRNRLPAEIPAHTHSTSKHENSLNSSNISTASSSLHSAPKKQPRPRENPSREHARRSDNNQIQRKDNNQLPLRDQIFV